MSPTTVMKVLTVRGNSIITLLVCSSLFMSFYHVDAKPANAASSTSSSTLSLLQPSRPVYTPRSMVNSGRKVLTSKTEDGSWQASARLPTSIQTGGNTHSRYKIRRDGSLSLTLQNPKPLVNLHRNNNHHRIPHDYSKLNWSTSNSRANRGDKSSSNRNDESRQFSPAELRSFSVVISDVDVAGNYNNGIKGHSIANEADAYEKAGVASYHLKSNSIHRMNASWKLKPGHGSPTSSDLLEFLSYFANGDKRATRAEHHQEQSKRPLRKILGQKFSSNESGQLEINDESKQPFLTWQESSRNIPVVMSNSTTITDTSDADLVTTEEPQEVFATTNPPVTTETINIDSTTDTENRNVNSSKTLNESKVVLHELISTLEELNENIEKEEADKESSSKVDVTEEKSKVNQTNNAEGAKQGAISEDNDTALRNSHHQTELDQSSTVMSENQQQQQQVHADVEMSESPLQTNNGREKEGDVFVQNDAAEILASSNSNNNTAREDNFSSEDHHDGALDGMKKRRSAKSAFSDSTKSTNSNDDDNNNTASTSATFLKEEEESTDNANSTQRMKITDPQQTASDLKKLMSLILKSDGNRNVGLVGGGGDGKSGTQVVNIVITPNQDESLSSTANHPQLKNTPQKILFLKNPQVKQMLDIALTDPALSSAAQKIAAALETNPFPNPLPTNIDHTYSNLPGYIIKQNYDNGPHEDNIENIVHKIGNGMGQQDNVPSTPDGFPLSGNGFLNLHHPNLQFHQALHHMVVNGSTPTSINATTKTNIINIFVINFKENNKPDATDVNQLPANQSPFRINIKPSPRPQYRKPKPPQPYTIKPLLIESVRPSTPSPFTSLVDHSMLFNNKMGLAAGVSNEDDENEGDGVMSSDKNYAPNKHFDMDRFGMSNSDKINIFDLLPGDIGTATAVQYAPGVEPDSSDETNENLNSNNNQTVSHSMLIDIFNAHQHQQAGSKNNNGSSSDMMPVTMPAYGDYFADFLPDRSREPPGSENMKPQVNENINDHNILSILTSSRKPTTGPHSTSSESNSDALLPPSLAHLEWIFKNQPPPKPQISPESLVKRNGQTNNNEGNASDSMMEPDETTNSAFHGGSTQELIHYLLELQNVTRPPIEMNSLSENITMPNNTLKPQSPENQTKQDNTNIGQSFSHLNQNRNSSSDENENGSIVEYTTKSPAFWKFGTKLPMGAFSSSSMNLNTEEALNNRLRKLLTAFGYSAIPTLAAGAAATWPYWVPVLATGRRRRRRRNAFPSHQGTNDDHAQITTEIIKRRGQQFLSNLMTASENGTASLGPSNRQLLSKSTKNTRMEETNPEEQKWIRVITATTNPFTASSSSPTLLGHHDKNVTGFHSQSNNNRLRPSTKNNSDNNNSNEQKHDAERKTDDNHDDYAMQKQQKYDDLQEKKDGKISLSAEQQLDVPLLKNFLKNVLYNELTLTNMNMNTPTPLVFPYSSSPSVNNAQKHRHPFPSTSPPSSTPFLSSTSLPLPSEPVVLTQIPIFTPSYNKIITKNGHRYQSSKNSHQQQAGGSDKNNVPILPNTPFSRPSSTTLPPLPSLLFPEYSNKGEDDSAEEQHQQEEIAGSDKKVISISTFSTPSPTSVYVHNRGDGTLSVVTGNNNSPWGPSFGGGIGVTATSSPDKISSSTTSSVTTSFTNIPHYSGHNDDKIHHPHHHHHHSLLSPGQTFNDANNHPSSSNADNFLNHFSQTNKRLQKIKLADSIKNSERSYTSAALLPLWFPIFFGNRNHNQLSSKPKRDY